MEVNVGSRFGKWEVIGPIVLNKKRRKLVLCRCDCGLERSVNLYALVNGYTKKCMKCVHESNNIPDEPIGTQFNSWTIIGKSCKCYKQGTKLILCRCRCGLEKNVSLVNLRCGASTQCQSCSSKLRKKPSIKVREPVCVGEKYGRWLVLSIARNNAGRKIALCRCECGLEKNVIAYELARGRSTQCRKCSHDKFKIIKEYNGWTVLKEVSVDHQGNKKVLCRCKCGKKFEVFAGAVLSGHSKACRSCAAKDREKNKRIKI